MADQPDLVIGVDLGGTKISCGLVDSSGVVVASASALTPFDQGAAAVVDLCADLVREMQGRARAGGNPVTCIGVGSAGVVDSDSGTIISATDWIPGWVGVNIRGELERRVGCEVFVLNDVQAHLVGESWVGAARGYGSVLLVTVGTGVGGAYLTGGRVLGGSHWLAGHLGHVPSPEAVGVPCACGRYGHLEAVASGPAIYNTYLRLGGSESTDAKAVIESAEAGEPIAREAVALGALALGRSIGGLINTLDPHAVIIGGGVAQATGLWWDTTILAIAGETLLPVENYVLDRPLLGQDSAVIGAARYAATAGGRTKVEE